MRAHLFTNAYSNKAVKGFNRLAVVRQLCANPGLSRTEVAEALGRPKSVVGALVHELIDEGWLMEGDAITGGDVGRRPTPLFVDGTRLVLLGAEVGLDGVRAVVASITGELLGRAWVPYGPLRNEAACASALVSALLEVSKQIDPACRRVIGIGLGLPGAGHGRRDRGCASARSPWCDAPVVDLLAKGLTGSALSGLPIFAQNEADVAAVGEVEFNHTPSEGPVLYLSLNQRVGAGIIIDDQLLVGHNGLAGEVGRMVLLTQERELSPGGSVCARGMVGQGSLLSELVSVPVAELQYLLTQDADGSTAQAVAKAGRFLGVMLHNLSLACDPACIVLGGSLTLIGDALLAPAMSVLERYANAAGQVPPQVCVSRFGADAVPLGAAALVRHRLTRPGPERDHERADVAKTTQARDSADRRVLFSGHDLAIDCSREEVRSGGVPFGDFFARVI